MRIINEIRFSRSDAGCRKVFLSSMSLRFYLLRKLVMQQALFKVKLKNIPLVLLLPASYEQVDFSVVNIDNPHYTLISKSTAIGSP